MAGDTLSLSADFPEPDEAAWVAAVEKALGGEGPEALRRRTADGIEIKALYRESDWPAAGDPFGRPGAAPFIRGAHAVRDKFLPWDIRQGFAHPDPAVTNAEILRDLERGVSSVELIVDPSGEHGCALHDLAAFEAALAGVEPGIAAVALDAGVGIEAAALLGEWARSTQEAKLAFNIAPLGALARFGTLDESLESAFARAAALAPVLLARAPGAGLFRIDARPIHEAGGSEGQELGGLIAQGIDTLRRLEAAGFAAADAAPRLLFTLCVGPNYGLEIAKLRAARLLWARCLEALTLEARPMPQQAVSSARMLTQRDPWVNLLRNTAACFAGGVGGADIVTLRPFTDAIGLADELGRRTARNTQLIAQEESQLGRVADPAGGAWFSDRLTRDLAAAGWAEFQRIEAEGGFGESLLADALQARVAEARAARRKAIAKRKAPVTGVSEFPLLDEIDAPITDTGGWTGGAEAVSPAALPPDLPAAAGETLASPLLLSRDSEPFERLRDIADARERRPAIFLATLGPLAEHTARADFARNLFAAGGIDAKAPPRPPESVSELAAAYRASGCALAILCGADARYANEAEAAARALKEAGVQRLYLAGRPGDHETAWRAAGVDSFLHIGVDVVAALELAHAELGLLA